MTSSTALHEYPRRKPSRSGSGQKHSTAQDAELTELLDPAPAGQARATKVPMEDRAHRARQQSFGNRYRNIELPEVVALRPISTTQQGVARAFSDEQRPSLHSSRDTRWNANEESETHLMLSSPATTLYTISHLVFFSILGTLARLGVEAFTSYPSAPFTSPVLWSNLGGSFVLGFLAEDRRIFREEWGIFSSSEDWSFHPTTIESNNADRIQHAWRNHSRVKKTIPLFIGLATGFCGSFTSFSSFVRDAFLALSNALPSPSATLSSIPSRNGGYGSEALLAVLIIHITVSISAYKFGAHLALALDPIMPTLPFQSIRRILDPLIVFLGFGSWIGAVLLTAFPPHQYWRGRVTYALVLAPLGCLLRFYVSKHLNPRVSSFPLGTFVVNILGTIILGMSFDLQHSMTIARDVMSCHVLQGVMDGFCGCATTVSTWVAELNGLERKHSYLYGSVSIIVALLFLIVIMGSLHWSRGFTTPVCK